MVKLKLDANTYGQGVYSLETIMPGETIINFTGPELSRIGLPDEHGPQNDYFLQVDDNKFIGPSGLLDDYINHSCNPNCGIHENDRHVMLKAISIIYPNEQICFDYSTTMDEYTWQMECFCGSRNCRKWIGNFTQIPFRIQSKYLALEIVPRFIRHKMQSVISS